MVIFVAFFLYIREILESWDNEYLTTFRENLKFHFWKLGIGETFEPSKWKAFQT